MYDTLIRFSESVIGDYWGTATPMGALSGMPHAAEDHRHHPVKKVQNMLHIAANIRQMQHVA